MRYCYMDFVIESLSILSSLNPCEHSEVESLVDFGACQFRLLEHSPDAEVK